MSRIAVVGAGPWGTYSAERVLQRARELSRPIAVTVLDGVPPGEGPNFGSELPDYAKLNYPLGRVAPWLRSKGRLLPHHFETLVRWLRTTRTEREWDESSLVPRRLVGAYFADALSALSTTDLGGSSLEIRRQRVEDVEWTGDAWRLMTQTGALEADAVLLATGVPYDAPPDEESEVRSTHAQANGLVYVDRWAHPSAWEGVEGGRPVSVLGMGISFVDVVLALTEGRGGRFVHSSRGDPNGSLRYEPSGEEPSSILPFSLDGLFPSPKPAGPWPEDDFEAQVLDGDAMAALLAAEKGTLDFRADVWPLVLAEMRQASGPQGRPLLEGDPGPVPLAHRVAGGGDAAAPRLRADIEWAARGTGADARRQLVDVWTRLFYKLSLVASFGRLVAHSQDEVLSDVFPAWNRLAFGPPLLNARKVEALIRYGLLDLSHAGGGQIDPAQGHFRLSSESGSCTVDQLVDARIPFFDSRLPPPLYRRLLSRGYVEPFVNRAGGQHEPGGLNVDERGWAKGPNLPSPASLAILGAPTEGCVVGTDSLPTSRVPWGNLWADAVLERRG